MIEIGHIRNEEGFIRIDERLIKEVFFAYRVELLRYTMSIIGDSKDAEDIVQTKLFELWLNRETLQFKEERAIKAWLYNGLRMRSVDYLRKAKSERKMKNVLRQEDDESEEPKYLDLQKIRVCAMDYLEQAIEKLPPRFKQVVKLHLKGYNSIEIGQQLGIHEGTVRSNLKRARVVLKKQFDNSSAVLILVMLLLGSFAGHLIELAGH